MTPEQLIPLLGNSALTIVLFYAWMQSEKERRLLTQQFIRTLIQLIPARQPQQRIISLADGDEDDSLPRE